MIFFRYFLINEDEFFLLFQMGRSRHSDLVPGQRFRTFDSRWKEFVDLVPGQRLKTFASRWTVFHASPAVKKLVKFGYRMKFDHLPKLSVPREKFATHLPREQMDVIKSSVAEFFLEKKAARKISYEEACQNPGFYSKLFAVPKPNGPSWRMIIDMRSLNSHISKKKFKMQGIKDVRNVLKKNMYGSVIDISDAYYHVSIHKR